MKDFEAIYEDSAQKVYHFLLQLTRDESLAEELTEETFYQAFLHIDRFRGDCEIDTWLCQIAKNAYYREADRRKRNRPSTDTAKSSDALFQVEEHQTALELHKQLHRLPEPFREVFTLRVFGELRFSEIAAIFGKSESWAKMSYYRAKAKLVEQMEVRDESDR